MLGGGEKAGEKQKVKQRYLLVLPGDTDCEIMHLQ